MKSIFESLFGKKEDNKVHHLFFMKTENVIKTEEDKTGLIINIIHDEKYKFEEIALTEKPQIVTKQRGVSKVMQDLELTYKNPGAILNDLTFLKNDKKGISILHIDPYKKCSLYGEHKGLEIVELSENKIVLEGEEADTFFSVDYDLAVKIIHEAEVE